jgi:Ketopantoate hydroxymethyltransferase
LNEDVAIGEIDKKIQACTILLFYPHPFLALTQELLDPSKICHFIMITLASNVAAQISRRILVGTVPSHLLQQQYRGFASKISALSLNAKKRKGKKISMVTAYDYPSAVHVARAGIDVVLVGDSVAMVELGHETTQYVTVDTMIHHCQSVKRGLEFAGSGSMLIGDMPFGSYEFDDTDVALRNAYRFVKEGGCDAIKLEVRQNFCTRSSVNIAC